MNNNLTDKRLLLGLLLVIVGGFIFVENLDLISDPMYFKIKDLFWHWPVILIFVGIGKLSTKGHKFPGLMLIIVGVFFMLPHWVDMPFRFRDIFWPAVFIFAGAAMLFHGNKEKKYNCQRGETLDDMDVIDDLAFFGGGDKIIVSQNFKGGKITCVFGGLNINLLKSRLSKGSNVVDVFAVFGGMKMLVPEDWDIKIQVTSIFGGFADKRNIAPTAMENKSGELIIKGIAIFGGGELKNF